MNMKKYKKTKKEPVWDIYLHVWFPEENKKTGNWRLLKVSGFKNKYEADIFGERLNTTLYQLLK